MIVFSCAVLVETYRNDQANALFVVYVETVLGTSCVSTARDFQKRKRVDNLQKLTGNYAPNYHTNPFLNDPWNPLLYQDVEASIKFE